MFALASCYTSILSPLGGNRGTAHSRPIGRISGWHENDPPRERLAVPGPPALSHAEWLALLLRVDEEDKRVILAGPCLLKAFGGIRGMCRAPLEELIAQHGIGEAQAALISWELSGPEKRDVQFLLGTRSRVQEMVTIAKGSTNCAHLHLSEIFTPAVRRKAPTAESDRRWTMSRSHAFWCRPAKLLTSLWLILL